MGSGQGTVAISSAFIAAGCNRVVGAVAWGPCDLVAFAAHHTVGIFSPADAKILITLPGHKDYVNCVLWLPAKFQSDADGTSPSADENPPEEQFLLSGSADGAIILWAYLWNEDKWRIGAHLPKAHEKAVTSIAAVMVSPSEAILSSTSSDLSVRIWSVSLPLKSNGECNISSLQALRVGSRAMVATSLTVLRGSQPIVLLAVGGLDNHVHFYAGLPTGQFNFVCQVKGHQDWIRDLDFSFPILDCPHSTVFLASCSQDKTIRLWRINRRLFQRQSEEGSLQASLKTFIDGPAFRAGQDTWQVSLESLLLGHEDWVHSVRWKPWGSNLPLDKEAEATEGMCLEQQPLSLLSASMDRMMMIWRPDTTSGVWINEVTVGELAQSALGFYGGVWSPRGDAILAHGYSGSFHCWQNLDLRGGRWQPHLAPSGHSAPVVDLAWAKTGQFLLSVSHDQTARLFACWNWNKDGGNGTSKTSWHEIGRPQVHGHDLSCLAVVRGPGNHCYVSGADEKVARVFEAPGALLETLAFTSGGKEDGLNRADIQIVGANMSALGLSQKPIYAQGRGSSGVEGGSKEVQAFGEAEFDAVPTAAPIMLTEPPFEEHLAQNTLWPESHKLYGHGNELFAICSSHSGYLVATACKAQSETFAQIWLWQVESWRPVCQLKSHALTVTQLEFSHNDRFLLSVSRDRHLSIFERVQTENQIGSSAPYTLLTKIDAHKRIIWTCSWSHCDRYFATGSRDKMVKIWAVSDNDGSVNVSNILTLPTYSSSVTALAWGPGHLLAVGMEDGSLELWDGECDTTGGVADSDPSGTSPKQEKYVKLDMIRLHTFGRFICHVATVHRLAWRTGPIGDDCVGQDEAVPSFNQELDLQLASCGADCSVRLFNVRYSKKVRDKV